MLKRIITYLFIVLVSTLTAQSLPKVVVKADTLAIRMGEQVGLNVEVQADTLSFVDYPEISELGDFEIVNTSKIDTLQAKPFQKLLKKYYITKWDTGKFTVPSIQITIKNRVFKTDSLQVQVLPVAVDTTQQNLYDFKPLLTIGGNDQSVSNNTISLWWLLLLFPLLLLVVFLLKRRKAQIIARQKRQTPYEKALQQLNKLQSNKLWLQNKVDIHYLQLTDTLKEYLEGELRMSVKEKLSFQILDDLQQFRFDNRKSFPSELLEKLKQSFNRADLAKFAKLVPNPQDIEFDFMTVKDVIEYAHKIVQELADQKAAQIAQLKAVKKKRRIIGASIAGGLLLIIALLGGTAYYFLQKSGLLEGMEENLSKPEWVYSEYGANPAIGITTPYVLKPVDISSSLDSLQPNVKQQFDEISFYYGRNVLKEYFILEGNFDLKEPLKPNFDIETLTINTIFETLNLPTSGMQVEKKEDYKRFFGSFTIDLLKIKTDLDVVYDSQFYKTEKGLRLVMVFYAKDKNETKEQMNRVLNSVRLIQDN